MNHIQGTLKAWLSDSCSMTPSEMQACIDAGKHEYLIGRLVFTNSDMASCGWVELGTANIEMAFHPQDEVIGKLAVGLREQISIVRAEAQSKVAHLEEKLSQLLALPNPDQKQGEAA